MKILIYRLGSLGDTLVALPAFRAVTKHYPGSTRAMLTEFSVSTKAPAVAEILNGTGLIDQYLEYPMKIRNPLALLKLRNRIRKLRPDVLVYLAAPRGRLRTIRDALFFYLCGIRKLIGVPYAANQQSRQKLEDGTYEYEGARLLRCIEALGPTSLDAPGAFDLCLTTAEHARAAAVLSSLGGIPILAASIGAKADVKDWGDENWRVLIPLMAERLPGWGLVLIGAPVERERSAALAALWEGPSLNLCGEVSVRGSAAVLSQAKIYVGHDSGPMHLAAAVGTSCVAIFSSRNLPGEWFPYGKNHRILYRDIECKGCHLTECVDRKKACILSISAQEVEEAVLGVITTGISDAG